MMPEEQVTTFVRRALGFPAAHELSDADWRAMLSFSDRNQLTLFLDGSTAPDWMLDELRIRTFKNKQRYDDLRAAFEEIDSEFRKSGLEFVLLKGFTHAEYGLTPESRVQYDLDVLTEPSDAEAAVFALQRLGYRQHSTLSLSDQHLPPMLRESAWTWKDDYYDPEIPLSIDIHTSVWNEETDRIHLDGVSDFWNRRSRQPMEARPLPALHAADKLAFAALHALRHILRNDARPASVFELGAALESKISDRGFWRNWTLLHHERLRSTQAVAFRFAAEWFGCALPDEVHREIDQLPTRVADWFDNFAWSPVENLSKPNKDVIWLHLALLRSLRDRVAVFRRRLIPLGRRGPGRGRIAYHASALAPALASGLRWWRRRADASTTASQTPS